MSERIAQRKPPAKGLAKRKAVKARASKPAAVQTQRERVETKEDLIIVAAYELFAAQGFAKTTMSEIARRASVAEGTLYLYFNNKDALARAVLAAFYERLTAAAQKGVAKCNTTSERLEFLARHHLDNIIKERRLLELISTADRNPENYEGSDIYKMNRAYVAVFDGVMQDGVWRGDIAEDKPLWILRDIFFGSLEYAMRTILMKRRVNGKDLNQTVTSLVSLLVAKPPEAVGNNVSDRPTDLSVIADRFEAATLRLEKLAKVSGAKPNRKAK